MKTAIITGVSGQDGSYLAKFLLKKDYKVVGIVRKTHSKEILHHLYLDIEKNINLEKVDLLNINDVNKLVQKYKPDEIYNLAAQSSVSLSFTKPNETFAFNTISVNNLLESIRLFSPSTKFYQASSSEMYGNAKNMPITIKTPMHPVSPYGVSKMASYYMAITFRNCFNLFICNGILFNHESFLRNKNYFVKKIIQDSIAIKNGRLDKLVIGNLDLKRDFGYAPKYIEAMWKILQQQKPSDILICTGKPILLRNVVEYVFNKLNISKNLIFESKELFRPNEIYEIYGENIDAKKKLNWHYELSFYDVLDILIDEEIKNFK